jgi:hypothetical protein
MPLLVRKGIQDRRVADNLVAEVEDVVLLYVAGVRTLRGRAVGRGERSVRYGDGAVGCIANALARVQGRRFGRRNYGSVF